MAFILTAQRFCDCSCKLGDVYQRWDFWGMIAGCWTSGWIHWWWYWSVISSCTFEMAWKTCGSSSLLGHHFHLPLKEILKPDLLLLPLWCVPVLMTPPVWRWPWIHPSDHGKGFQTLGLRKALQEALSDWRNHQPKQLHSLCLNPPYLVCMYLLWNCHQLQIWQVNLSAILLTQMPHPVGVVQTILDHLLEWECTPLHTWEGFHPPLSCPQIILPQVYHHSLCSLEGFQCPQSPFLPSLFLVELPQSLGLMLHHTLTRHCLLCQPQLVSVTPGLARVHLVVEALKMSMEMETFSRFLLETEVKVLCHYQLQSFQGGAHFQHKKKWM